VTQPTQQTQEQHRVMMEDFHDSARHAGKALDMVALVEARPIGLGDSTRTDWRGRPIGLGDSTGSDRRGTVPSSSGAPLATPPPSWRSEDAIAIHATPHVPDPPHEGCIEGGGSGEEEGAPGPATTDETRSYLDFYLDSCRVHYVVCSNYFMYFRIQFPVISHL
jgi:hypothetical protein